MIPIQDNARIFFHGTPVDLRNGFDGLYFLALSSFKDEMLPDTHFVFINPRRTRVKILYWSGNNLCIWYLRLRKGTFFPPYILKNIKISSHELSMILGQKLSNDLMQKIK